MLYLKVVYQLKFYKMLTFNFTPFPILQNSRLLLRRIVNEDAIQVFELRSNPESMKFIPRPLHQNVDDSLAMIKMMNDKIDENIDINWAVTLIGSNKLIGIVGFYRVQPENYRSEIGYIISPEFNGKGITTEVVGLLLEYGFNTLNLNSFEAIIDPENFASEKVLLKNNFVKEGHFKENGFYEGKFIDAVIYSILKRNFNSKKKYE